LWQLAKQRQPRRADLAKTFIDSPDTTAADLASAEIAGPGFTNFRTDAGIVTRGIAPVAAGGE
jgi:arginyl-tRNA synthetase